MQAVALRVKLRHLPRWIERRRALADRYQKELSSIVGTLSTHPRAHHAYHQYTIRTPLRDRVHSHLASRSIGSTIYYPIPIHQQKALGHLGYQEGDFPVAERASGEVLSLPMFPELTFDEQGMVIEAIQQALQ